MTQVDLHAVLAVNLIASCNRNRMQPTSCSTRIETVSLDSLTQTQARSLSVSESPKASVSSAAHHLPPALYNDLLAGLKASGINEAQTVTAGHTIRSTQFGPLPAVPSAGSAPDHTNPVTQEREKYHRATLVHPLVIPLSYCCMHASDSNCANTCRCA